MADTELERLEMRISKIESLLEQAVARREPADISADELEAYKKVRDFIAADWGEFCGINDCFRCTIVRCFSCSQPEPLCRPCDVECTCGPCNIGRFGGSMRRFRDLG